MIKAHIIPAGFFRSIGHRSEALQIYTNKHGARPKRVPVGVYDKSILCRPCDNMYSPWDKHAQEVLLRDSLHHEAIYDGRAVVGWRIRTFEYPQMKLFFLSLLWRASVSKQDFYRRVATGPFEEELRTMIAAQDPGEPTRFAVVLAKFDAPGYTAMLDPHPDRYDGVNYVRFYLAGFVAYIKVDRRPPTEPLASFILQPDTPITVVRRCAWKGKDGVVMRELARSS
ncbi:MAG: hypothetical protein AB1555_00805 [Nitrospirota bacterium]